MFVAETPSIPGDIHDPHQNHLLAALSTPARARIYLHLRARADATRQSLVGESGDLLRHVYLPTNSIQIPAVHPRRRRVGGNFGSREERFVGIALFMGGETRTDRRTAQGRVTSKWVLHLLPLRYTQALITHMANRGVQSLAAAECKGNTAAARSRCVASATP
jgi:hypothetical protein